MSATAEVRQDAPGTHRSLAVAVPGPVDLDAVRDILDTHVDRLIRAKGVVESTCGEFKVVQLAGDRVRVVPAPIGMGRSLDPCMVLVAVGPEADEDLRRVAQDLRALCEG